MRAGVAIGTGIFLIAVGVLGLVIPRGMAVALAQGTMSPGGMTGMPMMGGAGMMGGPFSSSAVPLSLAQAEQILRGWPAAHRLDGLVLDEIEVYTQNFYGQFKERSTGRGAIQVLVDRYTGRAMPEMGPNMMWNTKYGRTMMQEMMGGQGMPGMMGGMGMGGMMGGGTVSQTPSAPSVARVSQEQARQNANQFLSGYLPGTTVGDGDPFYGYYHFDVLRADRQVGMLSVNATTGQVWYHTWHGEFLRKHEVSQ